MNTNHYYMPFSPAPEDAGIMPVAIKKRNAPEPESVEQPKDLLPCPFCGSTKIMMEGNTHQTGWSHVQQVCQHCEAAGPKARFKVMHGDDAINQAIALANQQWNKRATPTSTPESDEELLTSENSIFIITPRRRKGGVWVFTDKARRLKDEPFVGEINDMIDVLVAAASIPHPNRGFNLMFSATQFPGCALELRQVDAEEYPGHGATYQCLQTGHVGWLCPAMFKYFSAPPPNIFASASALVKK